MSDEQRTDDDEWSAGITTDNRADGRHGLVFNRWPRKLRCEASWVRSATGHAIAHELRKLAEALEEADDA